VAQRKGSDSIRWLITALCLACLALIVLVRPPTHLPSVALSQSLIYRGEIGLAAFYAGLLILLPAYRGLINGRLPTSISPRGAEFAEEVDSTFAATQAALRDLQTKTLALEGQLARARLDIDELRSG
jgi:hypothetical protein